MSYGPSTLASSTTVLQKYGFSRWPRNYKKLYGVVWGGRRWGEVEVSVFPVVEKLTKTMLSEAMWSLVPELLWMYRSKENSMFQIMRERHPRPKMNSHPHERSPTNSSIVRLISSQKQHFPTNIVSL